MTAERHEPIRTCVGCGRREPRGELARLAADELGRLALVAPGRAARGRSAYVHRRRECVDQLGKSRLLARSLRLRVERAAREDAVGRLREMLCDAAAAERKRPGN